MSLSMSCNLAKIDDLLCSAYVSPHKKLQYRSILRFFCIHNLPSMYIRSDGWLVKQNTAWCVLVLVNSNFRKTSWQGLKKQEFWPNTNIRGFTKFEFTVAFSLKFHWYLRTLSLKFQKARTKIEVVCLCPVDCLS